MKMKLVLDPRIRGKTQQQGVLCYFHQTKGPLHSAFANTKLAMEGSATWPIFLLRSNKSPLRILDKTDVTERDQ